MAGTYRRPGPGVDRRTASPRQRAKGGIGSRPVDFSRLQRYELLGLLSSVLLVASLFLPWFGLTDVPTRDDPDEWVCGVGVHSCTGFDTFPILRWLLIAAATAPLILAYLILTAQRGQYPTGEFTATVGFTALVLIFFVGIISKPGGTPFGISLEYGYFVALLAGVLMAIAGALRSLESGGGPAKKPPGTF